MTAPTPAAVERVARALHLRDEALHRGARHKLAAWEGSPDIALDIWRDEARCAIAAHTAALAEEGFMIRPREPTAKMQDAGARLARCKGCDGFGEDVHQNDIWRAMADAYEPPGRSEPT